MADPQEMSCKELVELITEYLEGMLPEPERARFERHLAQCDGCQTYIEQMRQMIGALGKIEERSIPPEVLEKFLLVFRNWKKDQGIEPSSG